MPNRLNIFTEKCLKYACLPKAVPTSTSTTPYIGDMMINEQIRYDHGPSFRLPWSPSPFETAGRTSCTMMECDEGKRLLYVSTTRWSHGNLKILSEGHAE
jgi:hypothetical protein